MTKTILTLLLAGALLTVGHLPAAPQDSKADQVFASLDANQDGALSQAEFNKLFEMEGQQTVSDQEKQSTFKAWDADGDGAISKAEFSAKYR